MDTSAFTTILLSQFHAALSMLAECIEMCPEDRWDGRGAFCVGTMPCWEVAYHALCFVDCYLAPSNEAFEREVAERARAAGGMGEVGVGGHFHPAGMKELSEEHPSRRFEREELRRYAVFCRDRAARVLAEETEETLAGPSGFSWIPLSRAELHLYNLRHLAHHTGQLTAFLRRCGVETKWCKAGWREPVR
jgi:hypothetical protein